jgi:hypothetical protein
LSVDPAVAEAAGSAEKPSLVAVFEYTITALLVAEVKPVSEAVSVQGPPIAANWKALKVATPPFASTGLVPPIAHVEVIVIGSVKLVVARAPVASSTVTLKAVTFVLTVTADGG